MERKCTYKHKRSKWAGPHQATKSIRDRIHYMGIKSAEYHVRLNPFQDLALIFPGGGGGGRLNPFQELALIFS